jgi:hypothetical protein
MGEFGPDALAVIVVSVSDTQQRRATSCPLLADGLGSGGYLSARSQRLFGATMKVLSFLPRCTRGR